MSQGSEELALLPWRREVMQLAYECQECRQELPWHWQLCACCDIRLDVRCLRCGNPLPPSGASTCACCGLAMPRLEIRGHPYPARDSLKQGALLDSARRFPL
jgi:hypothetical protein